MARTEYLLMLHGDEQAWARTPADEVERVYAAHDRFQKALADRGDEVVSTHELTPAATARLWRRGTDGVVKASEGPFAELVEQLAGYYVIRTEDPDGLADLVATLVAGSGDVAELRAIK